MRSTSVKTADISLQKGVPGRGTFNNPVQFGNVTITVAADGYAPAFAGPFECKPGTTLDGLKLVLKAGFPGKIIVKDEEGNGIGGAQVEVRYADVGGPVRKLSTDEEGTAVMRHAAAHPVDLKIQAEGYQPERRENVTLNPKQPVVVPLRDTIAAGGVVISQKNGQPVEGAEVRLLFSRRHNHTFGEGRREDRPAAVTNAAGRFALNSLRRDRTYFAFVEAEGYGAEHIVGVKAGNNDMRVALGPPRTIHGTITGNLDRLQKVKGAPSVWYWNYFMFGETGYNLEQKRSRVTIENGVGHFMIDDVHGQKVNIIAGGENISLDVRKDDLDTVVVNLAHEAEKREVLLNFTMHQDAPALEGGVRIDYVQDGEGGYHPEWLVIENDKARCKVPVPCRFKYRIDYYRGKRPVGYWFPESEPVEIADGETPLAIDVPVNPAGGVYGQVLKEDGTVLADARASLLIAKEPDDFDPGAIDLANVLSGPALSQGTYNATPLPLNAEYAVLGYADNHYTVSNPARLDAHNPVVKRDVRFGSHGTIRGRLLDVDGTAAQIPLRLGVMLEYGDAKWSTKGKRVHPDERGHFVFKNVNPEFMGRYIIYGDVQPGFRPLRRNVDDVTKPLVIQLEKGRRLTGVVVEAQTEWPVPGADVYARRREGTGDSYRFERLEAETETDRNGRFVFSNMGAEEYRINVRGGANPANPRDPVRATGGQDEPVVLEVKIPEWSKLEPRRPAEAGQ